MGLLTKRRFYLFQRTVPMSLRDAVSYQVQKNGFRRYTLLLALPMACILDRKYVNQLI